MPDAVGSRLLPNAQSFPSQQQPRHAGPDAPGAGLAVPPRLLGDATRASSVSTSARIRPAATPGRYHRDMKAPRGAGCSTW
jgi:hypothetical protein